MKNPLKRATKPRPIKKETYIVEETPVIEEVVVCEETPSKYSTTKTGDVWVVSCNGKNIYQNVSEENAKRFIASKS